MKLAEVMRQWCDTLIEMLNKIRLGDVDDAAESFLKSKLFVQHEISYPTDTLHLFAENGPVDAQNKFLID